MHQVITHVSLIFLLHLYFFNSPATTSLMQQVISHVNTKLFSAMYFFRSFPCLIYFLPPSLEAEGQTATRRPLNVDSTLDKLSCCREREGLARGRQLSYRKIVYRTPGSPRRGERPISPLIGKKEKKFDICHSCYCLFLFIFVTCVGEVL